MNVTQEQLEWIVSEVVRRLRAMEPCACHKHSDEKQTPNRLGLTEKVITTETLNNRLDGVHQLEVPQRSVVTPAAVDLLKDHKIELIRISQR